MTHPVISPDGTTIAFEAQGAGTDIYTTPIDGGPVRAVVSTDADEAGPDWRPRPSPHCPAPTAVRTVVRPARLGATTIGPPGRQS